MGVERHGNVVQRLLMLTHGSATGSGGSIGLSEVQHVLGGRESREMRVSERDGWLSVDVDITLPLREARDDFERAYLEALAHRLKLPEGLAAHLDRQAEGTAEG